MKREALIRDILLVFLVALFVMGAGTAVYDRLSQMSDVTITTPADTEVLTYDEATGKWVNAASSGAFTGDLDDIDDGSVYGKATLAQLILWDMAYNSYKNEYTNWMAFSVWDKDYGDLINAPSIPDSLDDLSGTLDDISDGTTYKLMTATNLSYWEWLYTNQKYADWNTAYSWGDHAGLYASVLGDDDNYVTDAEKIVIGNTSGTNSGDNAANSNEQDADADLTTWAGITPAANIGTALATPTSANFATAVTNETGAASGAPLMVFNQNPTLNGLTTTSINGTIYIDGTTYARTNVGIAAAIAALPATGGKIVCTPGTYTFSAKVTVDRPVWFVGSGMGTDTAHFGAGWLLPDVTYFKIANGANCGFFLWDAGVNHGAGGGFQDIGFDGNLANNATAESLITFDDWSDVRFKDCFFVNQDNASYSCIETNSACWGMWFSGLQFEDCDGTALTLGGHRYWVSECHFRATLKGIVFANNGSEIGLMVSNSDFRDNDQEAIYLHKGTLSFIEQVHIYNASSASAGTDDGIIIDDTTLAVWLNNVYVHGNSNTNYGLNISDANSDYIFAQDLLTYATVAGSATVNASANTAGRISYQVLGGNPTIYAKSPIVFDCTIAPDYISDGTNSYTVPQLYKNGYIRGMIAQYSTATEIYITDGGCDVAGTYIETTANTELDIKTSTANTFYYIYLDKDDSTLTAETTVPVLNATYHEWLKTGDATRRCINGVRASATNTIEYFEIDASGEYVYYRDKIGLGSAQNPNYTWVSPDDAESSTYLPVMADMCFICLYNSDADEFVALYCCSAEQAAQQATVDTGTNIKITSNGYASINAWVQLGASRNVKVSGNDNDDNNFYTQVKGFHWKR